MCQALFEIATAIPLYREKNLKRIELNLTMFAKKQRQFSNSGSVAPETVFSATISCCLSHSVIWLLPF